jgi:hypothetical protein
MKTPDLVGQKFGRLTVLELLDERTSRRCRIWLCKCDCGKLHKVITDSLRGGHIKSCGCLTIDKVRENGYKNRIEFGESSFNTLFGKYKYQANRRGLVFELTKDNFRELTKQNCYYCGKEPTSESKATKRCFGNYLYNGIDRRDNSVGYTYSNCVSCCETCNKAKLTMSIEEFREWIYRLYEHQRSSQW